jgi:chromate reductase, NAD(P)H dehydrogenase (quinone)
MSIGSILVISGTNRPQSNALKIARLVLAHYERAEIRAQLLNLEDLPPEVFIGAAYAVKPPAFLPFQQMVLEAAGLHLVTPEYTGSFPGILKHFIDLLKFPESFEHKPVALIGEAAGAWGALRAVEQLQMIFAYRNAHVFPERVFIAGVRDQLDSAGRLKDPELDARIAKQTANFARFARALCHDGARLT